MEKSKVYVNEDGIRCVKLGNLNVCEGRTIPVLRKYGKTWKDTAWDYYVVKVVSEKELVLAATDRLCDIARPITLKRGRTKWSFFFADGDKPAEVTPCTWR